MDVIKIKKKIILIIIIFCLTGCTSIKTNLKIKNSNESTFNIEIKVPKLAFETLNYSCDDFIEDLKKFDIFKYCVIENNTNLMFESILINTNQNSISSFVEQYLVVTNKQYILSIPKEDISFVDITEIQNNDFFNYQDLKKYHINIYLNIIMPGNIINTTIGEVNLNKVSIDILDYIFQNRSYEDIKIVSSSSIIDTRYIYVIPIILVLLIFFIKKRKYYS